MMQPLALTATTLVTAIGQGAVPTLEALRRRRGGLRACDLPEVAVGGYIGRIAALDNHRLPTEFAHFECRNNRLADIALMTDGFAVAVAGAVERYGADRIAVILGTSTSGIAAGEEAYAARDLATGALPDSFDYQHTHDMFSVARFVRARLGLRGPAMVVSTACASSGLSFGDAQQLIESGVVDAAVVGGVDSLCRMTLHGFAALELISPVPCRPCDAARSGISIGEAGGLALLERAEPGRRTGLALLGYGVSSDGYHMSAPHPQGAGAIAAMQAALDRAGVAADEVDYVNLHGTGTRANDSMEDLAVATVFGEGVPCSSTKGFTGHNLGAAGATQALITGMCMAEQFLPGCLNIDEVDPSFRTNVLTANLETSVRRVVSNSFGFGGINCSLVLGSLD